MSDSESVEAFAYARAQLSVMSIEELVDFLGARLGPVEGQSSNGAALDAALLEELKNRLLGAR